MCTLLFSITSLLYTYYISLHACVPTVDLLWSRRYRHRVSDRFHAAGSHENYGQNLRTNATPTLQRPTPPAVQELHVDIISDPHRVCATLAVSLASPPENHQPPFLDVHLFPQGPDAPVGVRLWFHWKPWRTGPTVLPRAISGESARKNCRHFQH